MGELLLLLGIIAACWCVHRICNAAEFILSRPWETDGVDEPQENKRDE